MIVLVVSFCFISFPVSFPFYFYIAHGIGIEISQIFLGGDIDTYPKYGNIV